MKPRVCERNQSTVFRSASGNIVVERNPKRVLGRLVSDLSTRAAVRLRDAQKIRPSNPTTSAIIA